MAEPRTRFAVGPREGGKRLDRFLGERIPGLSRAAIQRAIRGRVRLSWSGRVRPSTPVRAGGEVRLIPVPARETPLRIAVPVLARGSGWLAVDKPPHVPVHPAGRVKENSLVRILRRQERDDGLRLAHRLDRETSGVVLLASDPATSRALASAFERGDVRKEYLALVRGVVAGERGEITAPIGPVPCSAVRVRLGPAATGKPSRTTWRVERRFDDQTLLRVVPATGRRHQIRVHLHALGHPVLGDVLYGRTDRDVLDWIGGGSDPRLAEGGPVRHMLHCARLVFPDPDGRGTRDVHAPVPADFAAWLERARPGRNRPASRAPEETRVR